MFLIYSNYILMIYATYMHASNYFMLFFSRKNRNNTAYSTR
jgi:hypothetical protein